MSELEVSKTLWEHINNASVGEKVKIGFGGMPCIVVIETTFTGGWKIIQNVIPGQFYHLIKGENNTPIEIQITFEEYSGINVVK